MRVLIAAAAALVAASNLSACAPADSEAAAGREAEDAAGMDIEAVEAEIWAMEEAIFEGRGQGDLSSYLSVTSDNYLGWPPVMAEPLGLANFRASADQSDALKGEVITLERRGFSMNGNTAVAYFSTHQTRVGDGMAPEGERDVDNRYENIHVWSLEKGEWRLIGGMARKLPPEDGRIVQE